MDTNIPTIDIAAALSPDRLAPWLEYELASHASVVAALEARHEKFLQVTANGICDDGVAGHATDFIKELKAAATATDETRTRIKAPVLHAQRLIDGEAKKLTDKVNGCAAVVTARITVFLRDKEAKARAVAEMEAARLAIEAEAKLVEAQRSATIEAADAAVEAMQEANVAAALATAAPIELTRTRSVTGALTGLKDNWQFRVTDLSKVPAVYLQVNEVMVKVAMKSAGKAVKDLKIEGLEIYNTPSAYVR